MIAALFKAFAQLSDPRLGRVLGLGVVGALLAYLALVALAWWALSSTTFLSAGWAETGLDALSFLGAILLPILFFPATATLFMSPWLDKVAEAVEERHYPAFNWPRPQKWVEVAGTALKFLLVIATVNLAALPVYGLLLLTGITVPLALAVNGYLLGREYYELVAVRWLEPKAARTLFRHRLGRLWLAGLVVALLFGVPFLNLAAPVIATAFMTHVFHSLRPGQPDVLRRDASGV